MGVLHVVYRLWLFLVWVIWRTGFVVGSLSLCPARENELARAMLGTSFGMDIEETLASWRWYPSCHRESAPVHVTCATASPLIATHVF